jgi:hypothetical protein
MWALTTASNRAWLFPYASAPPPLPLCFFFFIVSVGIVLVALPLSFSNCKLAEVNAVPPAVDRSCVGCLPSFLRMNSVAN